VEAIKFTIDKQYRNTLNTTNQPKTKANMHSKIKSKSTPIVNLGKHLKRDKKKKHTGQ